MDLTPGMNWVVPDNPTWYYILTRTSSFIMYIHPAAGQPGAWWMLSEDTSIKGGGVSNLKWTNSIQWMKSTEYVWVIISEDQARCIINLDKVRVGK